MRWLRKLFANLWSHKYSFFISLGITLLGIGVYTAAYLGEYGWAPLSFIRSVELKTYDTRFQIRGLAQPSPEIVIVAIDQKTLDDLGAWPFSRIHYVRLLDNLLADGAKVVGFDINFPKPDEKSGLQAVQRARQEYLERTPPGQRDPGYLAKLDEMERHADADAQFAAALRRADAVVLGQLFFFNPDEVRHMDPEMQQAYEEVLAFGAYTWVRGLPKEKGGPTPPPLYELPYTGLEAYLPQPNLLEFAEAANFNFGYFDFVPDADSIFRRTNLVIKHKQDFYPSLDVQVLRRYLRVPDQEFGLFYNEAGAVEYVRFGERRVLTDPDGRLLINYQGRVETYKHESFSDVAADQPRFTPGTFTGKMVLVGPTAKGIGDLRPVPLQEAGFPGVEMHANVLDTMLTQRFIHRGLREDVIDLGFILLFGLGMGFVLGLARPFWSTAVTVAMLAVFLVGAYFALSQFHMWLNIVVPGGVLVSNFGLVTAYRVFIEERERRKTRAAFQQYVSPQLIREMLKDPERLKLGGDERELSIMFSDIRGFTSLSEKLTAQDLTSFLNSYTDEMTNIIFRHWGTLDTFEGDAIMAFWGAPYEQDDHAPRACAAALDKARRVDELRAQWRAEGKPDINIGLGINTGRVIVGNMGSSKRFNYTVLGDPVNLASRLEGVNKEYATRIIVSETTYRAASDALGLLQRRVGHYFRVPPEALASVNGTEPTRRARRVALYLSHKLDLGPPGYIAREFGEEGEEVVLRAVERVEREAGRKKKLQRFLDEFRRSFSLFVFRQLDWIRVKGKREPIAIYELLDYRTEGHPWAELLDLFQGGLNAYRARQWKFAIEIFQLALEHYPNDGPSKLFLERCQQFMQEEPDPAWDGVYVMKTK
ncbi:MAG: CHASE2 domain-containing protein [Terriglobia bacterium]